MPQPTGQLLEYHREPSGRSPQERAETSERRRAAWEPGEFQRIASAHALVGALLCQSADVRPGQLVLDVAAGTGNAALAAAARGADVIATDFVGGMLEVAERRAEVEGLTLRTRVADAQALPFEAESFDVVLSTFGAMFAADQNRTVAELLRVCRFGGRIAMANWTPGGLVGTNLQILHTHLAPTSEDASTAWGTAQGLRELFGERISDLRITHRTTDMCAVSPQALVELHREHLAPIRAAFAALHTEGERAQLAAELAADFDRYNRATDGTLLAAAEYLEIIATKA